ncbi:MFS transporter [Sporothrix schenckii 1099-18]|uniref:MFS transporter n=1 Tax=Sporothrix schenckii 1099-18 TaxID=1397361 RepID=A0A0F2MF81_SPOSC|nr:MFS transporter [Sporothrix schenckii 1099-18]KJR86821.1 MFS transporter [Sporothrix schenckii 1099-18]
MESTDNIDGHALATNEDSPLLVHNDRDVSNTSNQSAAFTRKSIFAVTSIIGTVVLVEAASILTDVPIYEVLEDIICRQMGRMGNGDNGDNGTRGCSGDADVQAELAFLRGWQLTLELLPGILMAIPYGIIGDRYGRKVMFIVCMVGILLTQLFYLLVCWRSDIFPVRLTWAASIFTFIGGGPVILNGIVFAMLSDVSPEASRSTVFFYFGAAVLAVDVWAPIQLSLALFVPVVPLCLTLPETLRKEGPTSTDVAGTDNGTDNGAENGEENDAAGPASRPKIIRNALSDTAASVTASTAFLFNGADHQVGLLLATLLTTTLGRHAQDILLQFTRGRYDWSWAQAGYLVSLKAFVVLLLLLVLLPAISTNYALARWWPLLAGVRTPQQRDLWLARTSCVLLIVGCFVVGLAPTAAFMIAGLVVYCLENGYNLVLRSLLAVLVEPEHRGTLYNAAGILESTGAVIAGPLLAAAYRAGLRLGGLWTGLPFFRAVVLCSIALFILATARPPSS